MSSLNIGFLHDFVCTLFSFFLLENIIEFVYGVATNYLMEYNSQKKTNNKI